MSELSGTPRNPKEDEAIISFIEETLARHRAGGLDGATSLGSIAIVLSAWAAGHPLVERHFRS